MNGFFCDNLLCRLHIPAPDGVTHIKYREANGEIIDLERRKIIRAHDRKEFDLCKICAYAVALVNQE